MPKDNLEAWYSNNNTQNMTDNFTKFNSRDFLKLKSEWYKKLQESGFEDLEWHDFKTGRGESSPYLKKPFQTKKAEKVRTTLNFYLTLQYYYQNSDDFIHLSPRKPYKWEYKSLKSYKAALKKYKICLVDALNKQIDAEIAHQLCQGKSLRDIVRFLRSYYTVNRLTKSSRDLPQPPLVHKRIITTLVQNNSPTSNSFSIAWVWRRVGALKINCIEYAKSTMTAEDYELTTEELMQMNKPVGAIA